MQRKFRKNKREQGWGESEHKNESVERKRRKIPPPSGTRWGGVLREGGGAEGGVGGVLTVQRTESRELFPSIIEIYTLTSHLTKLW